MGYRDLAGTHCEGKMKQMLSFGACVKEIFAVACYNNVFALEVHLRLLYKRLSVRSAFQLTIVAFERLRCVRAYYSSV